MEIKVFDEGKKLRFIIPNFLIFNRIGVHFLNKKSNDNFNLTAKQMRQIRKIIRKTKRKNKDWNLVEVWEEGREVVKIRF